MCAADALHPTYAKGHDAQVHPLAASLSPERSVRERQQAIDVIKDLSWAGRMQTLVDTEGFLKNLVDILGCESSAPRPGRWGTLRRDAAVVVRNLLLASTRDSSTAIKQKLVAEGAVRPLISILRSGSLDSPDLAALQTLSMLLDTSEDKSGASAAAVAPLICLLQPESSARVRMFAADALKSLSKCPLSKSRISAAGGIPPIVSLLQDRPQNCEALQEKALEALVNLSDVYASAMQMSAVNADVYANNLLYGLPTSEAIKTKAKLLIERLRMQGF